VYSIDSLCSEFGISRHTFYGYRKKGLLPPPIGGRRFATYTDDHYRILRAIRVVVHDGRVTLADLAERLHGSPADSDGSARV
jgi:DNA-binding transcriptional MerR regulator